MKLTTVLKPEHILWDLTARDRDGVLGEISDFLKKTRMIRDSRDLCDRLVAREEILSTGIGNGVAIPHCKTSEIDGVFVALARSLEGVQFNAVDQQAVHLFFVVLSPPDQPNPHLQVLARISKLLRSPGAIGHLMSASSSEQLFGYMEQEEKKVV